MNDDEFVSRLRHATTEMPASTLDLEAVLRSSRRKKARHRSTVAAGCVAAVAGVGAVAPAVPGMLPDGGSAVASGGPASGGPASTGAACGAHPIDLDWTSARTGPVIRQATRVEVSTGGTGRSEVEVGFSAAPVVDGGTSEVPAEVTEEILAVATEQDRAGIYRDGELFDEVSSVVFDQSGIEAQGVTHRATMPLPFDGFVAASRADVPDTPQVEGLAPGVYIAFDQGEEHTLDGWATCGADRWPFTLRYQAPADAGVVACATEVDATVPWALKESFCPQGASAGETEAVWSGPVREDEPRALLRQLGLTVTG